MRGVPRSGVGFCDAVIPGAGQASYQRVNTGLCKVCQNPLTGEYFTAVTHAGECRHAANLKAQAEYHRRKKARRG